MFSQPVIIIYAGLLQRVGKKNKKGKLCKPIRQKVTGRPSGSHRIKETYAVIKKGLDESGQDTATGQLSCR
jgi:hypothetical protein